MSIEFDTKLAAAKTRVAEMERKYIPLKQKMGNMQLAFGHLRLAVNEGITFASQTASGQKAYAPADWAKLAKFMRDGLAGLQGAMQGNEFRVENLIEWLEGHGYVVTDKSKVAYSEITEEQHVENCMSDLKERGYTVYKRKAKKNESSGGDVS